MGLLYPFPVSLEESDFAIKSENKLVLKTYGLPYIFWFYAFSIIAVIIFMFLAIKEPVLKLIELGDNSDQVLGKSLLSLIAFLPLSIFSFLFYEKRIEATQEDLKLSHHLFGLKFFSKSYGIEQDDELTITHFLSSPNMARIKSNPNELGFQNKGYFILYLHKKNGLIQQIDRHSRKVDLEKLKSLLETIIKPKT